MQRVALALVITGGAGASWVLINLTKDALSPMPNVRITSNVLDVPTQAITPAVPPDPEGLAESMKVSYLEFLQQADTVEAQVSRIRALRWLAFASGKCQSTKKTCGSPQSVLLERYRQESASLKLLSPNGQLPSDAGVVNKWRNHLATIEDLALALSLAPSNNPGGDAVVVDAISGAISTFHDRAQQSDRAQQQQLLSPEIKP